MDKRYQVFISSTYSDLKEERSKVTQTIMALDCIPAGMELFPANDAEQFEFIKKIIDDCDYYILIIGGRYGSISNDGISYTEKEFDYAISKNIPIIAFLHSNINNLTVEKSDTDTEIKAKLIAFRDRAATGRLVKFWETADELNSQVAISLTKTIKTHPAVGWVRANFQASLDVLQEMNGLRKELAELREYKLNVEKNNLSEDFTKTIAGLDDEIIFDDSDGEKIHFKATWRYLFTLISPDLLGTPSNYSAVIQLKEALQRIKKSKYIDNKNVNAAKIHLSALGLIDLRMSKTTKGGSALFWFLTKKGKEEMYKSVCVKKE